MSDYQEFTGKSVEDALRQAREAFGVDLDGLDFEILTPGARGVLGMGAEPARIVAAPRTALGGAAPKREAAQSQPLPPPAPRDDRPRERGADRDHGPRDRDRGGPRDRGPRDRDRGRDTRGDRGRDRGRSRGPAMTPVSDAVEAEVGSARASLSAERAELQAAEASPEALQAAKVILENLMQHLDYRVTVEVLTGETNRLDVRGVDDEEREALGALIGRKGDRLSALQHIVNLMLSKQMGEWTRVLVDVEDYRGRRERQLQEVALRAADRVVETGRMLQLEPMPALERRWVHLALRDRSDVATQSIGEEPERRVVVLPANT
jgi:spoIIIJ-associated protein